MKTRIKVSIFEMVDFEALGDTTHTSISGGIASHSYNPLTSFTVPTIEAALKDIEANYGTPMIFEDRLELQLSDSTTLSFYLEEITIKPIGAKRLAQIFPTLEVY